MEKNNEGVTKSTKSSMKTNGKKKP